VRLDTHFPAPALPGSGSRGRDQQSPLSLICAAPPVFFKLLLTPYGYIVKYDVLSLKERILFKYFLSDRINQSSLRFTSARRINWIFSRFPPETVKIVSAYRRKLEALMTDAGDGLVYRIIYVG
jgi:hypothetical protein